MRVFTLWTDGMEDITPQTTTLTFLCQMGVNLRNDDAPQLLKSATEYEALFRSTFPVFGHVDV